MVHDEPENGLYFISGSSETDYLLSEDATVLQCWSQLQNSPYFWKSVVLWSSFSGGWDTTLIHDHTVTHSQVFFYWPNDWCSHRHILFMLVSMKIKIKAIVLFIYVFLFSKCLQVRAKYVSGQDINWCTYFGLWRVLRHKIAQKTRMTLRRKYQTQHVPSWTQGCRTQVQDSGDILVGSKGAGKRWGQSTPAKVRTRNTLVKLRTTAWSVDTRDKEELTRGTGSTD